MTKEISTFRVTARVVFSFIFLAALYFGSAGTLKWLEGWIFLVLGFSLMGYMVVWMKKKDPRLLRDRLGYDKKSPKGLDRLVLYVYFLSVFTLNVLPGLDAVRFQWSRLPLYVKIAGFVLEALAILVMIAVVKANPYLSSIVEVQEEKGQQVITTGPYKYVRHPWYSGILLWVFSVPLALGSLYSLIPAAVVTLALIVRIVIEEKTLGRDLPGYDEYLEEVKSRVIPHVW